MKQIIRENKGYIRAIIKKITGSYNEDLEQDVYIKTWRNLDKKTVCEENRRPFLITLMGVLRFSPPDILGCRKSATILQSSR